MTELTQSAATDLFRQPPADFIDLGDSKAAYRKVGTGPDVLFVHGFPVSGATFRKLLPHLAEHVTCHVIDLPGAGSSVFDSDTELSVAKHADNVRQVVKALGLDSVALVGHDSGGLIARHAAVGLTQLRSMGLINTEPSTGVGLRFKSFVALRKVPQFGRVLGWVAGVPALRKNKFVFGDAFNDRSLLEGEFDELFLQPLNQIPARRDAAAKLLTNFDLGTIDELATIEQKLDVPVQLVWGEDDKFFPLDDARKMVKNFSNANLAVIPKCGLFSHEERPGEVAAALLSVLR